MSKILLNTAATLVFACAATPAFAHAHLQKATPAVGATVASPSDIRLTFSEGVEPKFSGVTIAGDGGDAAVGPASVEAGHQNVLIVPVTQPLANGVYTVKWHAVSIDTHTTQGKFTFTVK
jgi:hypothetical protein